MKYKQTRRKKKKEINVKLDGEEIKKKKDKISELQKMKQDVEKIISMEKLNLITKKPTNI